MASDVPTAEAGASCVTRTSTGTARIEPPPPKMPSERPITPLRSNDETRNGSMLGHAAGAAHGHRASHLVGIREVGAPHELCEEHGFLLLSAMRARWHQKGSGPAMRLSYRAPQIPAAVQASAKRGTA